MKKSTLKQVEAYLGHCPTFYSSWMDEWREDPAYAFSSTCHTFPVDDNYKYAPVEGKMDALSLLDKAVAVVKDRDNQTDSAVVVNLKFIIHLIGDIHCPSHAKYSNKDTKVKVYPFKKEALLKYHSVWDGQIIDKRCEYMSPRELAIDLDRLSKDEKAEIQKGTALDWAEENALESAVIYDGITEGCTLDKAFYNKYWPYVQKQIIRGGYRLAKVLDECFAK